MINKHSNLELSLISCIHWKPYVKCNVSHRDTLCERDIIVSSILSYTNTPID